MLTVHLNQEPVKVEVGTNAIISVPGVAGAEGCKFQLKRQNSPKCCFANPSRFKTLCDQQTPDEECRKNYILEEEPGECVLNLTNFQSSDAGTYRVIFPGQPTSNAVVRVVGFEKPSPNRSWYSSLVALVLVLTIFGPAAGLLLFIHVWTPHQHEKILKSLQQKDYVQFSKLLERQNILKVQDQNMNGIFHIAAQGDWDEGKTKILVDHLRLRGFLPQSNDPENPPLAPRRSDIYSISQEYLRSYNLDSQNAKGETPLIVATLNNQEDVVETLLGRRVKVDTKDKERYSALFYAVMKGFHPIVKKLVRSDRSWEIDDMELVFLAAALGKEEILDLLLMQGANANGTWTLKDGRTCLMRAVQERNLKAVKLVKHRMEKDNEAHNEDRANALKAAQEMMITGGDWAQNQSEMEKLDDIIKTLKPKTTFQKMEKGVENVVMNNSPKTSFKKMGKNLGNIMNVL